MIKIRDIFKDKALVRLSAFCVATAALLYILYFIIKNFGHLIGVAAGAAGSILTALTPFFIGLIIAYLLSPCVELIDSKLLARTFFKIPDAHAKYERQKKIRLIISIVLTFILIIAAICTIIYIFTALIIGKFVFTSLDQMSADIINYFITYEAVIKEWAASLPHDILSEKADELLHLAATWFSNSFSASAVVNSITDIIGGIVNLILGTIISIYMLKDKAFLLGMCGRVSGLLLPRGADAALRGTLHEINQVFSRFIRGAVLDSLIVAILSSAALSVLGMQFAVFIGVFAGLSNIIPYFGPIIGMIPAFLVGAFTGNLAQGVTAVFLMFIIQQIDANIIYPKVVGATTGLHPLAVLLAITVAGYYGGIIGMVVAVPIAGILKYFIIMAARRIEAKKQP